jgi:hypothetical protein
MPSTGSELDATSGGGQLPVEELERCVRAPAPRKAEGEAVVLLDWGRV